MWTDPYPSLHQTVRVTADGTVIRGIDVPHDKRFGGRQVAAPPIKARNERRFAGLSAIPAGVDQRTTAPHDCANHLPGGDDER